MRIAAFSLEGRPGIGLVEGDRLSVVDDGGRPEAALLALISGDLPASRGGRSIALADVALEPPVVSRRAALLCVGKNYRAHAREFFGSGFDSTGREEVPENPVIFAKAGSALVGHGAPVRASLDPTGTVDYEGELAVVIGREAHKVPRERAYDVVFGYTICNDVTSRELQKRHNQWVIGKSLDTFGPLGPWIVTADEVGDVSAQELVTRVNGEVRQQAPIADLIFDIPTLIATLTATMTLRPGDIIATGTPAGVGIGFDPPRYLGPGDEVEVAITGIGSLKNPIV